MHNLPFTLDAISDAYQCGALPRDVLAEVFRRLTAVDDPGIFISLAPLEQLQEEKFLLNRGSSLLILLTFFILLHQVLFLITIQKTLFSFWENFLLQIDIRS